MFSHNPVPPAGALPPDGSSHVVDDPQPQPVVELHLVDDETLEPVFGAMARVGPKDAAPEIDPTRPNVVRLHGVRHILELGVPYVLHVGAPGYVWKQATSRDMFMPADAAPGDVFVRRVRLQRTGSVTGRVVGPDGQPLVDTRVAVREDHYLRDDESFAHAAAVTGDDGRFTIDDAKPGNRWLHVLAEAPLLAIEDQVEVPAGATIDVGDVRIDLDVPMRIRVVDAEGHPMPGVPMRRVEDWTYRNIDKFTDADGWVEFTRHEIHCDEPVTFPTLGYRFLPTSRWRAFEPVTIIAGRSTLIVRLFVDGRPLPGHVKVFVWQRLAEGRPCSEGPSHFVNIAPMHRSLATEGEPDSTAVYENLAAGTWHVRIPSIDTEDVRVVELRSGETTEVVFSHPGKTCNGGYCHLGGRVVGRVVDGDGHPVADATVSRKGDTNRRAMKAKTRPDGRFDFPPVPNSKGRRDDENHFIEPGVHSLMARHPHHGVAVVADVVVPERGRSAPVTITMPRRATASFRVRAIDAATGHMIPFPRVSVWDRQTECWYTDRADHVPLADGRVLVRGVLAGLQGVEVAACGFSPGKVKVDVEEGRDLDVDVRLEMAPPGSGNCAGGACGR